MSEDPREQRPVAEDRDEPAGEEVRSPLQAVIRVVLALVVIAVLAGLILAIVLRPGRMLEPPEAALPPVGFLLAAHAQASSRGP